MNKVHFGLVRRRQESLSLFKSHYLVSKKPLCLFHQFPLFLSNKTWSLVHPTNSLLLLLLPPEDKLGTRWQPPLCLFHWFPTFSLLQQLLLFCWILSGYSPYTGSAGQGGTASRPPSPPSFLPILSQDKMQQESKRILSQESHKSPKQRTKKLQNATRVQKNGQKNDKMPSSLLPPHSLKEIFGKAASLKSNWGEKRYWI